MDKPIRKRLFDDSDDVELRELLIRTAQTDNKLLFYSQVVNLMYCECWTRGMMRPLCNALDRVGNKNRQNGEPLLPALVVAKKTKLPGPGFFEKFCPEARDTAKQTLLHEKCIAAVRKFDWPD